MYTTTFLENVLGEQGHYCLFAKKNETLRTEFVSTIAELKDAAVRYHDAEYDVYFALATFEQAGSRTAANALEMRCLFLDLDCGDDAKKYDTQDEALVALQRFCEEYNLPKPYIINSGYGLHVYWPLSEPVSKNAWWHVADRLKSLCMELDYMYGVDLAVPADAARVLRVPNTTNYKYPDTPKPVLAVNGDATPTTLEQLATCLGEGFDFSAVIQTEFDPFAEVSSTNHKDSSFRKILERTGRGDGCEQLGFIASSQNEVSEPLWRAGLSIAVRCTDGDVAIHKISNQYVGYSPGETQLKAERTEGPYTCGKFDSLNPGLCRKCPHFGQIKSPIVLGQYFEAAEEPEVTVEEETGITHEIPPYPWPYKRRAGKGGVYIEMDSDDDSSDSNMQIYPYDLYAVRRVHDPDVGESMVVKLHLPNDPVRTEVIPLTAMASQTELKTKLGRMGVIVDSHKKVIPYMQSWIKHLQDTTRAAPAHIQFGWTEDMRSFVLGDVEIFEDRLEANTPSDYTIEQFNTFTQKGDLESWKHAAEMYNRADCMPHQFALCCGFGSILMGLTTMNGCGVNFRSPNSGEGKSTMLYAASSIYGEPRRYIMKGKDTNASLFARAETYHSLPLIVDEITSMSQYDVSPFILAIADGMQRARMSANSNRERPRGRPWHLITMATGNASLISMASKDKQDVDGEVQRMFEVVVPKPFLSKKELDNIAEGFLTNYGHAAIPFIQYIIANREAVRYELDELRDRFDHDANIMSQNRFWSILHATAHLGGRIACEMGFLKYDMAELWKWQVDKTQEYAKSTQSRTALTAEELLDNFISEHQNNAIKIRSSTKVGQPLPPDALPRGELVMRFEPDLNMLYVRTDPLRRWLSTKRADFDDFVTRISKGFHVTATKKRLTQGTDLQGVNARVLAIQLTDDLAQESFGAQAPKEDKEELRH